VSVTLLPAGPKPYATWPVLSWLRSALLSRLQRINAREAKTTTFDPDGFATPRPFIGDELWNGR
jgi:hypothetical protein